MAQRDNRHNEWVLGMHHPAGGPPGRCPVQPSTPMGPDQVNVYLFIYLYLAPWGTLKTKELLLFGNHSAKHNLNNH
jgi:hypothetical protein